MNTFHLAGLAALVLLAGCGAAPGPQPSNGDEHAASTPVSAPPPESLAFSAELSGKGALTATPSLATATAAVELDPAEQTIDLRMTVRGLTLDQLSDPLTTAPIGPIHFHMYADHDHADPNAVSLAVPVPFGPAYLATSDGFTVTLTDFAFADAEALTGSATTFEAFTDSLRQGLIQLNIHTDAFPDGEIGGIVTLVE